MPRQIASPSPVPPPARTVRRPSCWNFLNRRPASSGAMPWPWSVTQIATGLPAPRAPTSTRPRSDENLIALESRFVTTWTMRSKSTRTSGVSGATSDSIAIARDSAKPLMPSTAISMKSTGRWRSRSRWMWPASILEMSRMLLMSRMRRSVFLSEMSTRWRWGSASTSRSSSQSRCSGPLMDASGVRSSCDTVETNSVFIRSISRSRVTSRIVTVAPTTAPRKYRVGLASQRPGRRSPAPPHLETPVGGLLGAADAGHEGLAGRVGPLDGSLDRLPQRREAAADHLVRIHPEKTAALPVQRDHAALEVQHQEALRRRGEHLLQPRLPVLGLFEEARV